MLGESVLKICKYVLENSYALNYVNENIHKCLLIPTCLFSRFEKCKESK